MVPFVLKNIYNDYLTAINKYSQHGLLFLGRFKTVFLLVFNLQFLDFTYLQIGMHLLGLENTQPDCLRLNL